MAPLTVVSAATVISTDEFGKETVTEDVPVSFFPSQTLIDLWDQEAQAACKAAQGDGTFDPPGDGFR